MRRESVVKNVCGILGPGLARFVCKDAKLHLYKFLQLEKTMCDFIKSFSAQTRLLSYLSNISIIGTPPESTYLSMS